MVKDCMNGSYISSVLVALFYSQSHILEMLTKIPENSKFVYLQNLINDKYFIIELFNIIENVIFKLNLFFMNYIST